MDNNELNWDKVLFDYHEGLLRPEEKEIVEETILEDPVAIQESKLWKTAFVKESTFVFENKSSLLQPTGINGFVSRNRKLIGATLVLLLSMSAILYLHEGGEEEESLVIIPKIQPKEEVPVQIVVESKKKERIVKKHPFNKEVEEKKALVKDVGGPFLQPLVEPEFVDAIADVEVIDSVPNKALITPTEKLDKEVAVDETKKEKKQKGRPIKWRDIKHEWKKGAKVIPMD